MMQYSYRVHITYLRQTVSEIILYSLSEKENCKNHQTYQWHHNLRLLTIGAYAWLISTSMKDETEQLTSLYCLQQVQAYLALRKYHQQPWL